jgi:predicted nucleic acid-binding protein
VKIVDANVPLYAVTTASEHHRSSLRWLDGALSGADTVGFTWLPLLAFVRLSTKEGLFHNDFERFGGVRCIAPTRCSDPAPRTVRTTLCDAQAW